MASSKKYQSNPTPRSRKPRDPYYTRHNNKRASLSQNVHKRESSVEGFPLNQATMTHRAYSGCNFDLYLKGIEVWLRSHPQSVHYGKEYGSRINAYEFCIGIRTDNSFDAYSDVYSVKLLDGFANHLGCTTMQILHRCESYCQSVNDYHVVSDKLHGKADIDPYRQNIKKLAAKVSK